MSDRAEVVVTGVLLGLCLLVSAWASLPRLLARDTEIRFETPQIAVAVDGAVASPGVYQLPFRSTVGDAVEMAGGYTGEAEASLLNPARGLSPGDRVHVPERAGDTGSERVSVNSASEADLQRVPGIGPVTAKRIVEARPYSSLGDLLRVKGIGEKTLDGLRDHLRL